MQKIKFGTSGWRAVIADEFTFAALRRVVYAIGRLVKSRSDQPTVLGGYDARFMGEKFAEEAAKVLLAQGVKVQLTLRDVPTPAVSATIIGSKLDGAVNITASHNPAEYSGIKFSPAWGGPALPEDTEQIEAFADEIEDSQIKLVEDITTAKASGGLRFTDCKKHYFELLRKNIDFGVIRQAGVRVVFDPLYGSARDYFDELLESAGIDFSTINGFRDPYFGGGAPEPDRERLAKLRHMVQSSEDVVLGLATDGDGDRFGIIDRDGSYISPNQLLPLLADYLYTSREEFKGKQLVRSVATTHMMDRVAVSHKIELIETPVGFKYIGELLAAEKAYFGGEESAGLSMLGHVPEKDGILACLLALEMVAKTGKSLEQLVAKQHEKMGRLFSERLTVALSASADENFSKLGEVDNNAFGLMMRTRSSKDGFKFIFNDDQWLLFRKSGTEPVVRIYAEATNPDQVRELLKSASLVLEKL
jgi:alpha-D-glucose phosphate-specific phosphoglucomutase